MIIINISIDDIDTIHKIGAVRIKPKYTPKLNELCIYEYGFIDNKNSFITHNKLEFPYGDALALTTKIIEELRHVNTISSLSS